MGRLPLQPAKPNNGTCWVIPSQTRDCPLTPTEAPLDTMVSNAQMALLIQPLGFTFLWGVVKKHTAHENAMCVTPFLSITSLLYIPLCMIPGKLNNKTIPLFKFPEAMSMGALPMYSLPSNAEFVRAISSFLHFFFAPIFSNFFC